MSADRGRPGPRRCSEGNRWFSRRAGACPTWGAGVQPPTPEGEESLSPAEGRGWRRTPDRSGGSGMP